MDSAGMSSKIKRTIGETVLFAAAAGPWLVFIGYMVMQNPIPLICTLAFFAVLYTAIRLTET